MAPQRRVITVAGAVALLVLQVGTAALLVQRALRPPSAGPVPNTLPDVLGAVEFYTDDGVTVNGAHRLESVRLDASTVVTMPAGPARRSDLRPGAGIAVWGRDPARIVLVGPPT